MCFLTRPQKRVPLKSKPKNNAAIIVITSPIPLNMKTRVSMLVSIARDRASARTNMAVLILDLELRNGEDAVRLALGKRLEDVLSEERKP
jgi:hypothetical protein